jgi:nicotinamide riboside kinase
MLIYPWEFDRQREHPHLREYFFDWYQQELQLNDLPYAIVSGSADERVKNAIGIIKKHFPEI